jgi:hypothetical protein
MTVYFASTTALEVTMSLDTHRPFATLAMTRAASQLPEQTGDPEQ